MKISSDPRHRWRIRQFKLLYQSLFQTGDLSQKQVQEILKLQTKIDRLIRKYAPEWPIDKINKVDLSILRLAVYELLTKHAPYKVVINEAVEIAKTYGSDRSGAFVNGVLGKMIKQEELIKQIYAI